MKLFEYILWSMYFMYNGFFYEQVEGVAMGSPLSSVIAKFYMEAFERRALEYALFKPLLYKRYVDGTLLVWPHGHEALMEFVSFQNSLHENITFTVEVEQNGQLPFLDIMIKTSRWHTGPHSLSKTDTYEFIS